MQLEENAAKNFYYVTVVLLMYILSFHKYCYFFSDEILKVKN